MIVDDEKIPDEKTNFPLVFCVIVAVCLTFITICYLFVEAALK